MPITPSTGPEPEAKTADEPKPRRRAAPPKVEVKAEAPAEQAGGITRSTEPTGGGITRTGRPGRAPTAAPQRDMTATVDSWAHTGDEAAAKSQEEAATKEAEKASRVRWPRRFQLNIEPPKNQADIIILDERPGPRFYMHMMRGPYDNWPNTPEPCPREFEICPICPPNGEHHSSFVMVLTVLNIAGYQRNNGQWVGASKELLMPRSDQHAFFDELYKEHGSLRGVQLLMHRDSRFSPYVGVPTFKGKHSEEEIETFLRQENLWAEVIKEGSEEVLFPEGSMAVPFDYNEFIKKPSAADLLSRYGGSAPMGSDTANTRQGGSGQFGGGRYAPRPMQPGGQNTNFGGFGGGSAGAALDDEVPF